MIVIYVILLLFSIPFFLLSKELLLLPISLLLLSCIQISYDSSSLSDLGRQVKVLMWDVGVSELL